MAMTLRLDDDTSAQLRDWSEKTGRSQQLIVLQAIQDALWMAKALGSWLMGRRGLPRAFIARPVSTRKDLYPKLRTAQEEAARDARYQAMIDSGFIKPATGSMHFPAPAERWPSPPGGSLSLIDREDRV